MKNQYLIIFTLIILSCGNNTDESKTRATIDAAFKNIDSIAKGPQLTQFKPLPAQLGFTVSLINEEIYNKAVNKGIRFVPDTSDFKKLNGRLELYNDSKKVFEFIDTPGGSAQPIGIEPYDNEEFYGGGYYIIKGKKWYMACASAYEMGSYIIIPPPYNKTYGLMTNPVINPSGTYLFDLFFTALYEFQGEWSLYNIANSKLEKISSHKLDCRCANNHIKNKENSLLCPQTKEAKWISDKELLIKIENFEGDDKGGKQIIKSGYLKLTIK